MTASDPDPRALALPDPAPGPSGPPGQGDAVRATIGVIVSFVAALLLGGLAALLSDPGAPGFRSAGSTRAQLAVQAIVFAAAALLLMESLRLMYRPRTGDPLASARPEPRPRPALAAVLALGLAAAVGAYLVGPLVGTLLPGLEDHSPPVDELGIGAAVGSDLATVLVVAGLIPLGEELLFRGVLVGAWVRARRPAIAVVLSTVLFSLAHVTVGGRSMAVTALLGALFAAALMLSGSLGAPVLAHCTVNAIALVEAGLVDAVPVAALVMTVVVTTLAAWRLSPLVSWKPPGGTLRG